MELRHLRYFVAVAEELHFGRAALRLHISQPPLSQQIQALETELGVKLFERNARNVALTAAGISFLAETRATLAQADRAVTMAQRAAEGRIGVLRVGYTPSVPFIEPFRLLMRRYKQSFPHVDVKVVEMVTRHQVNAMVEDRLDVGFIRSPLPQLPDEIRTSHIFDDRLTLIVPKEHRFASWPAVPIAELKGEPLILMSQSANTGLHNQVYALCAANGFVPTVAQEASGAWTPLALVSAGLGISIVYSSLIKSIEIADVIKLPIDEAKATGMVMLAHPKVQSATAMAFSKLAQQLRKGGSPAPVTDADLPD